MLDDQDIIERLRHNDRQAWRDFLERYERLVYAVPRRYGLSPEAAADVFQETLLALLRGLPRLRDARALPRWLTHTAYRLSRDRARKDRQGGAPRTEEFWASVTDARPLVEDELIRLETLGRLHAALPRLSPRCRGLLIALFLEDTPPSYEELAARLETPIGSIGPTRQRCLKALLELLSDSGTPPVRIKKSPSTTFVARRSSSPSRTRSRP